MSDEKLLTETFLDQAPKAAAHELQQLPHGDAAALIETVPARLCAVVVDAMIPWNAARLLELVSPPKAAAIVRQLSFADGISLCRLVAPDKRESLFEGMPSRYASRLRNALQYPQHQVGAWIDPDIPTLRGTDTVGDALQILREANAASHVFLESGDHERFDGLIAIQEVVRGDSTTLLGQLRRVECVPISNRASLDSLAFDARWDELLHLPVVGRRGNLLGGLSRSTLRHAIHEQYLAKQDHDRSLVREVFAAMTVTTAALVRLLAAGAQGRPPITTGAADHDR